jgi:hypothetical protein
LKRWSSSFSRKCSGPCQMRHSARKIFRSSNQ